MDISIQTYVDHYKEMVMALISKIQQSEFHIDITPEEQPDLMDIPNFYQKGNGNFWLAISRGEVVGTISLLDIGGGQVALRKMFVKKERRGKEAGVAGKLLETLLSWAKDKGVTEIFLGTTPKFLAAHRFYEKNGFLEIPKNKLPDSFPIMKVDTKFYRYLL